MITAIRRLALLFLATALPLLPQQVQAGGTWTRLTQSVPGGGSVDVMLLLTDGTVMAHSLGEGSAQWFRLTPDIHGSYVNGTWTTLAPMHDGRTYFSSSVLKDGRVFVAGGEYGPFGQDADDGLQTATAEVYDPLTNTWTITPQPGQGLEDCESRVLPNGTVLVAPNVPSAYGATAIYNPSANTWSVGPTLVNEYNQSEASWVQLPDNSILTIDPYFTNSERFIPSSNTWVADTSVPVDLWSSLSEIGPALLLPDGRAFFLGGNGFTAFYTPSGNTNPGTWVEGPNIPNGYGIADSGAAMMVNGKVLCVVGDGTTYSAPAYFYEFDPVANSFTAVNSPDGAYDNTYPYLVYMLTLPDGTVLCTDAQSNLAVYTPSGTPLASGKPKITSIKQNADASFHLVGTLLNGISEGAAYGDDYQMSSNYPIVRFTSGTGNVYYARTYNRSSTSIQTGSASMSTEFTLPVNLPAGSYSVTVSANGISSDPFSFTASPIVVTLPASALEGSGTVSGTVTLPTAPSVDTTVSLTSSLTSRATVPKSVIVTAGTTSANFSVTIPNDALLNGNQAATISATATGYQGASAHLVVIDDESAVLSVSPASVDITRPLTSATTSGPSSSATITLTNTGSFPLTWKSSATYVTLSPTSGTIAAGATTSVTVTYTPAATAFLSIGSVSDHITFWNVTSGVGDTTLSATASLIPTAPVLPALPAISGGSSRSLTWNASYGAYSYTVEASTSPTFATLVGTQYPLSPFANFTGLSDGVTYYYRAMATGYDSSGYAYSSPWSNVVSSKQDVNFSNANLSNLAISAGILTPSFASSTTHYTATVSNATTSIIVTPTPADPPATTHVAGVAVASGASSHPIALAVGDTTITVVVTAADGKTNQTYTLVVHRNSTDASLSALTLSGATLSPAFVKTTTSYTANVLFAVGSTTVTAKTSNAGAVVSGNTGAQALNVGPNPLNLLVTAEDGNTETYAITVNRAPASTNASLSALAPSAGTLSPVFKTGTTSYTSSVPGTTTSITVRPTLADLTATVEVNGAVVKSGVASAAIGLLAGPNTITVLATAQDGMTTDTYTLTVNRLVPPGMTTTAASNLTTTGATLSGTAVANNESTTVSFDYGTSTAYGSNVVATQSPATGTTSTPISATISGLKPGTLYHYRAKGISAAGTTDGPDMTFTTISTVDTLSALKSSVGTLSPAFVSGTLSYTATVLSTTTSIMITPTVTTNSHATVTVNGVATTSGTTSAPVMLNVGANVIPIEVTAQDGVTKQTYLLNAIVPTSPTAGTLAATAITATTATLNGTVDADGASTTASFNYGTLPSYGKTAAATPATLTGLAINNVSAKLTGLTPKTTYHFQAKAVNSLGTSTGSDLTLYTPNNVATLSGLVLSSGPTSPLFTSAGITYTAKVGNTVASIMLTPTVTDSNATVAINGVAATSGSPYTVNLNVGSNVIRTVVTAEDKVTTRTYTLTVTRTAIAPNMTTVAATGVSTTSATLNGSAIANFANTTLSFDYGVATALSTNIAATPTATTGNTSTPMSVTLNNLKPGTTYSFRAKGVNLGGTGDGTPLTFTTINTVATLSALKLNTGTLSPAFATATTAYKVTVPDAVTSLTVTPTVTTNSKATVTVNGNSVASGTGISVPNLNYGTNTISVLVTAQDGVTQKTYTITVTRLTDPTVTPMAATIVTATTATINGTVLTNGSTTTASFNYGTTSPTYGKTIAATPATITVATTTAVSAKLTGLIPHTLYHFQVKGVSAAGTSLSSDQTFTTLNNVATLSGLALGSGNLSPAFASTTVSYTSTVPNSTSTMTVMPTLTDTNASVTVNGLATSSGGPSSPISLNTGSNLIHVIVTAQDHVTTKAYTITITRSATGQQPAKTDKPASPTAASSSSNSNTSAASGTTTPGTSATSSTADPSKPTTPVVSNPIKAQLTGPVQNGSTLPGASAAFTWNAGRGVTDYRLSVGSTVGGTDIYDGDQAQALAHTVTVPTDGADIYVTLHSFINGVWKVNNYVFTAADTTKAVLTVPADGSLVTADATGATTFTWNHIPAATNYWLRIGSTEGGADLYDSTEGTASTQPVILPTDGRQLFVTLATNINGQWLSSTSTLTATSTTPAGNSTTTTTSANSGATSATTGSASTDTSATAAASSSTSPGATPAIAAQLTAPADHVVLTSRFVTFTWDAGSSVSQYWLSVGSSAIATDLYNASQGSNRTVTIAVPIDGSPIYVTISSLINGQWQSNQYLYQAPLPP